MRLFLLLSLCLVGTLLLSTPRGTAAQRNAAEEAICSRFLTSPQTSPLNHALRRDVRADEEAEFSCELVLQDRFLPAQIRATIHQGLFYLASTHAAMGVRDAPRTAMRHATVLAQAFPQSFAFQYNAAYWAASVQIARPIEAVRYFNACIYGEASEDRTATAQNKYLARRQYVQALSQLVGRESEAAKEIVEALRLYPLDYELVFLAEEMLSLSHSLTADEKRDIQNVITHANHLRSVMEEIVSAHGLQGESPSLSSSPRSLARLSSLPSAEEFQGFVDRREPFVLSLGDLTTLDNQLNWRVRHWVEDAHYLEGRVGEEEVLVETLPHTLLEGCREENTQESLLPCAQFGAGLSLQKRTLSLSTLLSSHFRDANRTFSLGTQLANSGEGAFRSPLHKLKDDIDINNIPMFEGVVKNMTSVYLVKGEAQFPLTTRPRRDATDSLFVLLQGEKKFSLWEPASVASLRTLSPSYALNADGLSYQFSVNAFADFVRKTMASKNMSSLDELFPEGERVSHKDTLQTFLQQDIVYSVEDSHFSTLSVVVKDGAQQCGAEENEHEQCRSTTTTLPAPSITVRLLPGDILYLPTGWFHQSKSSAAAHTAVNFWWKPPHWRDAMQTEKELGEKFHATLLDKLINS